MGNNVGGKKLKISKRILQIVLALFLLFALVVAGYAGYSLLSRREKEDVAYSKEVITNSKTNASLVVDGDQETNWEVDDNFTIDLGRNFYIDEIKVVGQAITAYELIVRSEDQTVIEHIQVEDVMYPDKNQNTEGRYLDFCFKIVR